MVPDESGVAVIPNNNFFPNRNGLKPRYVILHGTAGGTSAEAIARYFASTEGTANAASSHYIIGRAGEIVQAVSERDGAWANGYITQGHDPWWNPDINPNNITISIEHCKPSADNSDSLTSQQQQASFKLVQHICGRWNIPLRAADASGGVTGHFSMDPVNRSRCPGAYPWDALWVFLKGGKKMLDLSDPVVSRYFSDGGNGAWKCKNNGVILHGGILTFYRSYGGPALLGLPTAGENYSQAGAAYVVCERALIIYDPNRRYDNPPIEGPCYLIHLDSDLAKNILLQRDEDQVHALSQKMKQIHDLSQV
jgi:hypothetical protein